MSSNIEVKLDVLNQKASPALYAASLANRPAASFTGRLFVDSDSPSTGIYRDTGTSWVQVADQGAGTTGTLQQVTTNGSSTTIGISTSGNGIGIGTTIPAANRLDIHSSSGINATFNGTGTSNAALQLQLAGTGKWNLSNFYNAGANDFIVADVTNSLNRITVKNTGQTFIGADTTSSGTLVVNSANADSHIVTIGANAPSFRIRNTGTAPTLNVGLGISTGVNNFIQSSASGDFCIFNGNTTANPITFGIYDAGASNIQEAARISAARNFLVGPYTSDNGAVLQITGKAYFSDKIGLGSLTPAGYLEIYKSVNSAASYYATNPNTGIAATAGYYASNDGTDAGSLSINILGTGYTTSGNLIANTGILRTGVNVSNGISMIIDSNAAFKVNTNNGIILNGTNTQLTLQQSSTLNCLIRCDSSGGTTYNTSSSYQIFYIASVKRLHIKTNTINISSIPTSSSGLVTGDIYSNAGILTIVP